VAVCFIVEGRETTVLVETTQSQIIG